MVKDTNTIQTFRDKWNKNTSPQSSKEQTFSLKVQGNHCRTPDIQNTNIPDVYRLTHSYCFFGILFGYFLIMRHYYRIFIVLQGGFQIKTYLIIRQFCCNTSYWPQQWPGQSSCLTCGRFGFLNPSRNRSKLLKQEVTALLLNAWQQV